MSAKFVLLGTAKCKYCCHAKNLLIGSNMSYTYLDLEILYPDNWKQGVQYMHSVTKKQNAIPLIFMLKPEAEFSGDLTDLVKMTNSGVSEFIGGYFELEELLDTLKPSMDY
jgi:hypothetical protein